ncbi:uncharacterized protein LAESUDRAFT_751174 [Laetiporus sulphureus 93-53]|uniref:Uncharacterized protein n=1 Tax=Laetiporus sulphureus 93-53 TaxID=1314785 RepID=A0A165DCF9_9APHY|nr:uncharacterized protein LAESUDRAFT_751174 [Laetiporus sulphureus 93-53]KZT04559.1 hypothetical protein LAESUDRAFT_751174 [Laetiporus sulphureus 93-53]
MERNANQEPKDEESEHKESEDVDYLKLEPQQREEIISNTLTFLQNVCAQSSALPVSMQEDVWRMYYGTMCQMVHLQMGNWTSQASGSQRSPSVGPTNQPTDPANSEATARRSSAEDLSHNPETGNRKSTYELPPPIDGFIYSAESHTFESLAKDLISLATAAADPTNAQRADTVIIILRGIAFLSEAPRVFAPRDKLVECLLRLKATVHDIVRQLGDSLAAAASSPESVTGSYSEDRDVLQAAHKTLDALTKLFGENSTPASGGEAAGSVGPGARDRTATGSVNVSDPSSPSASLSSSASPRPLRSEDDTAASAANSPRNETTTASDQPVVSDFSSASSPSPSSEPRPAMLHHDTSRTAVETPQNGSVTPTVPPAPAFSPNASDNV